MSSTEPLAVLAIDQRNQLESLLMKFDSDWSPELLGDYRERLASSESQVFRKLAVAELVKIDLHRSWSSGEGKLLEEYCHKIPDLGDAKSVDPDLILVEFAARRSVEPDLELQSYAFRFPNQFDQLASRADQFLESNVTAGRDASLGPDGSRRDVGSEEEGEEGSDDLERAQASIDTSRVGDARDTQANRSAQATTLPKEFGRYRIVRELGAGAMGRVYLAHDTQLDRDVAIKTPSFSGDKDDELVTRFYREAKAAAKIDHRNICPIYDVGEIDGSHFISMAFVKGRCMSEYLRGDKLPPQKTSAILIHRLALALAEAHHHKVVHRDLKPANIMINAKHEPVVMDFGLARQTDVESRMTQSGMIVGTPAYMSPEQISGENDEVTPQVDIYALGVILYEMLTGKLPFRGAIAQVVHQIMNKEPVPPSKLREGIDPELESICAKMMAKDRDERFQSMDHVAGALKGYLQGRKSKKGKRTKDVSGSKEEIQVGSETGALNAFFLAQGSKVLDREPSALASGIPNLAVKSPQFQDSVIVERPEASVFGSAEPQTNPSRGGTRFPLKSIAVGLAGALIVLFGIVYLVKTPYGTLRVQAFGELADLEVLVDGDTVSLTEPQSLTAADHEFALKLGGTELKFDPATNQFVMAGGRDRRLTVTIDDLQLSSKSFIVTKNTESILKVELLPNRSNVVLAESEDFVPLFNGNDLDGWTVYGNNDWSVIVGEIVCEGSDSKLVYDSKPLTNFDIRLDCLLERGSNSGLFLRTGRNRNHDEGYEVQLATDTKYGIGSIWGRAAFDEKIVEPSTWFAVAASIRGNRITVNVNGRLTVEYSDPKGDFPHGYIALQGHKGSGRVRFRNIRVREIEVEEPASSSASDTSEAGVFNDASIAEATALEQAMRVFEEDSEFADGYNKRHHYAVTFSPTGNIIDTANSTGAMRMRRVETGEMLKPPTDRHSIEAITWSSDGSLMALGFRGGKIEVWEEGQPQPAHMFQTPSSAAIRRVNFSPNNSVVFACSEGGSGAKKFVDAWSLDDESASANIDVKDNGVLVNRRVFGAHISPDGRLAVLASGYGVQIWNLETGKLLRTIAAAGASSKWDWVGPVAFSKDSKRVAWADYSNLRISDVSSGKLLHDLVPGGDLYAVAPSPSGQTIVTASSVRKYETSPDGVVNKIVRQQFVEWDLETGGRLRTWSCSGSAFVRHLVFSVDGRYLAAAGYAFPLRVWDLEKEGNPRRPDASSGTTSIDHRVAKQVLALGGRVWVRTNEQDKQKSLHRDDALWNEPFQLSHLYFKNRNVSHQDIDLFCQLPKLESMIFDDCGVTDKDVSRIATVPTLMNLDLESESITDAGVRALVAMNNLVSLRIVSDGVTGKGLKDIGTLSNLENLTLSTASIDDTDLASIAGLTKLQQLTLNDCGDVRGPGLIHLQGMRRLTSLAIRSQPIDDSSLIHLKELTELEFLDLRASNITGSGLAALNKMQKLKTLGLRDTPLRNVGLESIGQLHDLRVLILHGTGVTDAGLKHLAGLNQLETLYLGDTNVTDEGVKSLSSLPRIRYLALSYTRVTDASVEHLKRFPVLQDISLLGTQVSANGIAELRRALPTCEVTWQPSPEIQRQQLDI